MQAHGMCVVERQENRGGCKQAISPTLNEIEKPIDIAYTLRARDYKGLSNRHAENNGVLEMGFIDNGTGKHQSNTVFSADGIARAMQACDTKAPIKIIVKSKG